MIEDLKIVVDKIGFLLRNARSTYLLSFENDKDKVFDHL